MTRRLAILSVVAFALFLTPTVQAEENFHTYKVMSLGLAQKAASAALQSCRAAGFQVAVAVVDRSGVLQVLLRDRFAGPHTPKTARQKAWTAVSFRTNTSDLADATKSGQPASGARGVRGALMLGGGKLVESAGSIVGGIGVSGAPSGKDDDACADAGIESIRDALDF